MKNKREEFVKAFEIDVQRQGIENATCNVLYELWDMIQELRDD